MAVSRSHIKNKWFSLDILSALIADQWGQIILTKIIISMFCFIYSLFLISW